MATLRHIDTEVVPWFEDDIGNAVERARWIDRAQEFACCGPNRNSALYDHYMARANTAFADSISPDYAALGRLALIAPVPTGGDGFADPAATMAGWLDDQVSRARRSGGPAAMRRVAGLAAAALAAWPDGAMAPAAATMLLLHDRLRFADEPVSGLLDRAEALEPGPLRDALLDAAQDALEERIGHLAPLLAADAAEGSEADRADAVDRLLAEAKRLAMLRDDFKDALSAPSGLMRSISGLKAASGLLALADGDASAKEALGVINDLAGSFPASPTSPFAVPAGVVAGQLGETRRAWDLASDAITGIGDAIAGDPSGLRRAQDASRALNEVLSPRNFGRAMTGGLLEGVASSLPFVRSFVDWLTE